MVNYLRRPQPSGSIDSTRSRELARKEQPLLPEACIEPLHVDSDRAKSITKAQWVFIAKDMQPSAVAQDAEFLHKIKVLELRYNIPSCQHKHIPLFDQHELWSWYYCWFRVGFICILLRYWYVFPQDREQP